MKIVIEISEKDYRNFALQNDNGVLEETVPSHRAKIAIAEGQILPDNSEILTAEAYSDLCLRASEQKVGKWIELSYVGNDNYSFMCSECGFMDTHTKMAKVNYCWHCGAKMEGADNEQCRTLF